MTLPATDAVERRSATASELLYLVGTDLVPIEQLPDGPARQLANEYRSRRLRLAPHLIAVALWSLQRQGVVSLELRRSKTLGLISRIELVVGLSQPGGAQRGIEGQLLSTLARKQPRDVGSLVRDWFGRPSSDVDGVVMQRVYELASELTKRSQKALDSRRPVDSDGGDFGGDGD